MMDGRSHQRESRSLAPGRAPGITDVRAAAARAAVAPASRWPLAPTETAAATPVDSPADGSDSDRDASDSDSCRKAAQATVTLARRVIDHRHCHGDHAPGTEFTVTGRTVIIMMITVSDRHVTVQVLAKGPGPERLLRSRSESP
jgi:hypothetical protein